MSDPHLLDWARRLYRIAVIVSDNFERTGGGSADRWTGSTNDIDDLREILDEARDPDSKISNAMYPEGDDDND